MLSFLEISLYSRGKYVCPSSICTRVICLLLMRSIERPIRGVANMVLEFSPRKCALRAMCTEVCRFKKPGTWVKIKRHDGVKCSGQARNMLFGCPYNFSKGRRLACAPERSMDRPVRKATRWRRSRTTLSDWCGIYVPPFQKHIW